MDEKKQNDQIQLFEDQKIRTAWDAEQEAWYFSVVDVVGVLTDQPDTRHAAKYWSVLKTRLKKEGNELPTNCSQLKLKPADGETVSHRRGRHRTAATDHPVHPLPQGGALQSVAGSGGPGAHRRDHRPEAGHRPGSGDLPEKGLLGGVGPPAPAGHPYPK